MTRPTNPITGQDPARALAGLALILALALVPAIGLRAESPATSLRIANTGASTEGLPTFRLDWDASFQRHLSRAKRRHPRTRCNVDHAGHGATG